MIVTVIGIISLASFIAKVILQIMLDGLSANENGRDNNDNYHVKYFLPYYNVVPTNYLLLKKICNSLYYIFLLSICAFLIVWNLVK